MLWCWGGGDSDGRSSSVGKEIQAGRIGNNKSCDGSGSVTGGWRDT